MSESSIRKPAAVGDEPSFSRLVRRVLQSLGVGHDDGATLQEDLRELLDQHEETGQGVNPEERMILMNLVTLGELRVGDVMLPRADIVAVDETSDIDDLIKAFRDGYHSRLPLFRGTLDHVVGMTHIKDLLGSWDRADEFNLAAIMREVLFVPASMPIWDLLLNMRTRRIHMAVVVDEFGGTDGLATIEDLVEAIVGEIEDEHDAVERPLLVEIADGVLEADARAPVADVEARMECDFLPEDRDDDISTLGGAVAAIAGRVPQRGEVISHPAGVEFEIVEADARRVKRLRLRKVAPAKQAGSADGKARNEE
jgi:magnesium and cobalt transporter